jgi:protein TonB
MGALLTARPGAQPRSLRERLPSIAVSAAAHAALAYVIIFAGLTVITPQDEVQTISVSIAAPQLAQPAPPPMPKLERLPDVISTVPDIVPPMLEIAAPPSQMTIQATPPSPPAQSSETRSAEDAPLSPPRFDAAYLNNPAPVYPNMSRRLRETGVVQLRVRVSATGQPLEVQMSKSSGYARLDEAARAAVQAWKFQAALRNGTAVEAWVIVPVEFSLTRA